MNLLNHANRGEPDLPLPAAALRPFPARLLLLLLVSTSTLTGCGGSGTTGKTQKTVPKAENTTQPEQTASAEPKTRPAAKSTGLVKVDEDGRKWIGEIPYDVYFDDPLEIANDSTPVPGAARPTSPAPESTESTETEPLAGDKSTFDWGDAADIAILDAEVKRIRNALTGHLRALGQYNAGYREIQVEGGTLAAVAGIVIEHPETLSWKEDAKYVRDLGTRLEDSSQRLGRKSFDEATVVYEQLVSVLSRNRPPDLPEAEERVPFAERVDRGTLMRRFQVAFDRMRSNVPSQSDLKEQAEMVIHESTILAALTRVIMTDSYDLTDDEEFMQLAGKLFESARSIPAAVENEDFDAFQTAISSINNTCTQCHTAYRD